MNSFLGSPALRLLLRLKLRGLLRRQWRRLRTPKGFLLTLLGAGAFCTWIGSLLMTYARPAEVLGAVEAATRVRAFGLVLFLLSVSTALSNRGLYLHKSEIERLFSAPLSRAELVRYRLLAGSMRSLLGGLVLGLFGAHRMPNPPLAFLGIVLAMQTLPVVNQFLAIALGGLEERASASLKRVGNLLLFASLALAAGVAFAFVRGRARDMPGIEEWSENPFGLGRHLLEHPVVASLSLPFAPWARAISAASLSAFWPWFLVCLALHGLLIEACASLPIDFRELSLATSARAAARIARFRRGGGVAATRASAGAARWRIPWLFGRGPGGAIAWRKCAGMARKAKGALWMALMALLLITFFAGLLFRGNDDEALRAQLLIAFLGTIYLCSGLRFDFREELERMDAIRAWPLSSKRVFLATLLPEVLLVSLLVGGTLLLHAAFTHGISWLAAAISLCLPFLVFAWVALDNIVFLVAPVRFVPGQDGFVQNAGRRMVQMALLGALGGLFVVFGYLGYLLASLLAERYAPGSTVVASAAIFQAVVLVLAGGDLLLVLLGGFVLRRFDVARDRG